MPELVMLHYAEVAAPNWRLFAQAAARREITIVSWRPHLVQVRCAGRTCRPMYDGQPADPPVLLHRTVAPFQGTVSPALQLWAERGSRVLNQAVAAYRTRDKLATTMALCAAGVPVVPTLAFSQPDATAFAALGEGPLVLKPAHGLRGRGIRAFGSAQEAVDRWSSGSRRGTGLREHYLAQPLVGGGGRDIRGFVVGGACVALAQRTAVRRNEIRANLALGGTARALPLDHPAADLAVAAATACGLDYGGVDLIEDGTGRLSVLEVDAWAGFAGLTRATGVDVAGAILDLATPVPAGANLAAAGTLGAGSVGAGSVGRL